MKKLIITTVALVALTFVSCKKDNLQPVAQSNTSVNNPIELPEGPAPIETENNEDKAIDYRNRFIGMWKSNINGFWSSTDWFVQIDKWHMVGSKDYMMVKIKKTVKTWTTVTTTTFIQQFEYAKIHNTNKNRFAAWEGGNAAGKFSGYKTSSNSNKLYFTYNFEDGAESLKLTKM